MAKKVIKPNMLFNSRYSHHKVSTNVNSSPSVTVPNQSRSIKELFENFTMTGDGMREPFYDKDVQLPDGVVYSPYVRDLTEIDEARQVSKNEKARINEERAAQIEDQKAKQRLESERAFNEEVNRRVTAKLNSNV